MSNITLKEQNQILFPEERFQSSTNTPEDDRFAMFQKALAHEKDNDLDTALECFLHCIKDLKGKKHFAQLPQCLHKVGFHKSKKKIQHF